MVVRIYIYECIVFSRGVSKNERLRLIKLKVKLTSTQCFVLDQERNHKGVVVFFFLSFFWSLIRDVTFSKIFHIRVSTIRISWILRSKTRSLELFLCHMFEIWTNPRVQLYNPFLVWITKIEKSLKCFCCLFTDQQTIISFQLTLDNMKMKE